MKKNILFIGNELFDFLVPFFNKIKDDVEVTVIDFSTSTIVINGIRIYRPFAKKMPWHKKIFFFFNPHVYKYFFQYLSNSLLDQLSLKVKFITAVKSAMIRQYTKNVKYDVINLHQINLACLPILPFLNNSPKNILSFWGSDLYKTQILQLTNFQTALLKHTTDVTVHSDEMKVFFYSVFAQQYTKKVHVTLLPVESAVIKGINNLDTIDAKNFFYSKYSISSKKKLIMIGNSGSEFNNHLQVIDQLSSEKSIKDEFHLIFPVTYGLKDEYLKSIEEKLNALGFTYTILAQRLTTEEMVILKSCTDIYIHVPKTDAFSLFLSESFYAGSIIIVGNWLPYSRYKQNSLAYYSIDNFNELPSLILNISQNYTQHKLAAQKNRIMVENIISFSLVSNFWTKNVY